MNRPVTRSRLRKESPERSTATTTSSATKKPLQKSKSSTSSKKKQIDECPEQEKETVISQEKTPPAESRSRRSRQALKQVDVEQIRHVIPEKERIVVRRTPSMKDTFPGRLEWKKKHYDKPVTSTPVGESKCSTLSKKPSSSKTKDDVQSCFGFDDSTDGDDVDENYSVLISPILKEKDKDKVRVQQRKDVYFKRVPPPAPLGSTEPKFNDLLERYTHGDHSEEDDELHVNTKGIKATYANRHVKFGDVGDGKKRERSTSSNKSSKSTSSTTSTATTTTTTTTTNKKRPKKPKDVGSSKKEHDDADLDKWLEKKNKEFDDISNFPLVLEKSP